MSAPRKLIDEAELTKLASFGLTQAECAALLDCSPDTIQRHVPYAEAYLLGLQNCKSSLRRRQYELAIAGNVTMLIWLGKNLLDQSDRSEVTGKGGQPLFPPVDREELIGKLIGPRKPAAEPLVQ